MSTPVPGSAGGAPRRSPRSWFWRTPAGIAAVVLILLVALLAVVELSDSDRDGERLARHLAVGPLAGRQAATFDLVSGVTSVRVRAADLGGDAYRIATPPESGQVPAVADSTGAVDLQLRSDGGGPGPSEVYVLLSDRVAWTLRLAGGAADAMVDLSAGKVSEVDIVAGMTRIELALPAPRGTVPVRLAGGASDFTVRTAPGVQSRARIGGGAGTVDFNGSQRSGVSAGAVFSTPGYAAATDRYDLNLSSGVSVLTVRG